MKMRQHARYLISLLADMRLKEKEGTQSTLVRIRCSEILMVPIWVTLTSSPFGKVTEVETVAVMVVKKEMLLTSTSVNNPRRILWIMKLIGFDKLRMKNRIFGMNNRIESKNTCHFRKEVILICR